MWDQEDRREKKGEKGDPGATTADGVSYKDSNVANALDELTKRMDDVQYTPIQITSFSNNVNTAEMGSTVNTVVLNWGYNKEPKKATLDGSGLDVKLRTKTIEGAGIKSNKTILLLQRMTGRPKQPKPQQLHF